MAFFRKLGMIIMVSGFGLTAAQSADYLAQTNYPILVDPVKTFSWTGFHIGLNGGGIKLYKYKNYGDEGVKYPIAGMAGIQAGYDHQFGPFVLGIEGDANFSSGSIVTNKAFRAKASIPRLYTVRGRGGFAVDRMLVYATGGWTNMNIKAKLVEDGKVQVEESSPDGWTVGGGLQYAFTDSLSLRGEYLYVKNRRTKIEKEFNSESDRFSLVRAGLNYKF